MKQSHTDLHYECEMKLPAMRLVVSNVPPTVAVRGTQEAGFTQPRARAHPLTQLCEEPKCATDR